MDPEDLYKEVLQEEQQKGSSPPVAEGRAKAARQRAIEGSPHPKEPKWWPGAQPQFEGGEAAEEPAEEPVEEPAEQPAAEEPAEEPAEAPAEQPAAQAPAEQPAAQAPAEQPAAQAPAEQPAAQAPAEQPAAQAPAEQPAAQAPAEQPAAQAPAEQPAAVATQEAPAEAPAEAGPERLPAGVSPGRPSGNRLRPEDAVSTDAQFDGQRAMYQRRKLIDELVATGVPAVTAAETGRERSGLISILFLLIPLLAVGFLVLNSDDLGAPQEAESEESEGGGGGGTPSGPISSGDTLVASDLQFSTDEIRLQAGEDATIEFDNQDDVQHNLAIYEDDSAQQDIFVGEYVTGASITYDFGAPEDPGTYFFRCDAHPTDMIGEVRVQ